MPTVGSQIDSMFKLREKKRALEAQVSEIEKQLADAETVLLEQLDKDGTTKVSGKLATISVTESIVPQVQDWDALYAYLQRKKAWYLLERRPSVTGFRELFQAGSKIPGVTPFTKRKLNLRTL